MLQFGSEFLKLVCEGELEVCFGDQAFVKVGLPLGEDFGLVLRHADVGQAFDEVVGVEGYGFCFHRAQNSGWRGGLQAGAPASARMPPPIMPAQTCLYGCAPTGCRW